MAPRHDNTLTIEGAQIIFRNFAGKEGKYNREGDRNFAVLFSPDDTRIVEKLAADGWSLKYLTAREEGDVDRPYLQVSVSFKGRPPRVVMLTSRGRTNLREDEIEILDWADIENVDLIVRPYEWVVADKSGVKAYLKSIFVTIREDALELKYADVENAPRR
jgi:hypothetical protein